MQKVHHSRPVIEVTEVVVHPKQNVAGDTNASRRIAVVPVQQARDDGQGGVQEGAVGEEEFVRVIGVASHHRGSIGHQVFNQFFRGSLL